MQFCLGVCVLVVSSFFWGSRRFLLTVLKTSEKEKHAIEIANLKKQLDKQV